MDKTFDSFAFVEQVGNDLVGDFEKARRATTPELVGDSMEGPTRDSLEQLLPRGLAAGSGCVIDREGRTSRQLDVVIYERDFCPVFRINNSSETTYYPCEGVLAVGEVKSQVGKSEFDDAVKKVESVKVLNKQFQRLPAKHSPSGYLASYRNYAGTDRELFRDFDPEVDSAGDIVGFLLTDKLRVKHQTTLKYYETRTLGFPDMLISLEGHVIVSAKARKEGGVAFEPMRTSDSVVCFATNDPFGFLVFNLQQRFRYGKTVELSAFEEYFIKTPDWAILDRC